MAYGAPQPGMSHAAPRRMTRFYLVRHVTSPLERSLETAGPIATALGLAPEIEPAPGEMSFGEWTGRSFEELEALPHGDVLRAVVAHYLGLCIDLLRRFMVEPASITTLHVAADGATLVRLNDSPPVFETLENPPSPNGSAAPAAPEVAR